MKTYEQFINQLDDPEYIKCCNSVVEMIGGSVNLETVKSFKYFKLPNVPKEYQKYQEEVNFLLKLGKINIGDKVLDVNQMKNIYCIIIPKKYWWKGERPSSETESDPSGKLIKISEYNIENNDNYAWLVHEIIHSLINMNNISKRGKKFYKDIKGDNYPNDCDERYTFGYEIIYLKSKGMTDDEILELFKKGSESYSSVDGVDFFKRLLQELKPPLK